MFVAHLSHLRTHRAGVGRTGTFIAADVLRRHLKTEENAAIDIPGILLQLRRCRPSMIENLVCYQVIIHTRVLLY